jgi:hypothetical protein
MRQTVFLGEDCSNYCAECEVSQNITFVYVVLICSSAHVGSNHLWKWEMLFTVKHIIIEMANAFLSIQISDKQSGLK